VIVWSDDSRLLPHYAYSAGIVSGDTSREHFSVIGSVSAADTPLRIVFTDGLEHFWDGLYIDAGDIRRDVRLAFRKELGSRFLLDVSSMAGTAAPGHPAVNTHGTEKLYVAGDVESTFSPTRTTVAVSYRQIQQPQPNGIIRHVDIGMRVIGLLHPEQIEFDDASRVGQFEQPAFVKDRAIDMTKDEAIHRRPARQEEIRHFLRLIFMAPRVDVDGRPPFPAGR